MQKIIKYIKNPLLIFSYLGYRGFLNWLPDTIYLKIIFRAMCGYSLDLKNPRTFNEKIQWLKLYGNLEKYTDLVDKYEVRKYIAATIGEEYLIPLIGVWDRVEDIDFAKLPEQFVLKCNHDSGSVVICKDKNNFDIEKAKKKLKKCLKRNFYCSLREPQYKNIKQRIICEKYMVDESGTELKDYRIFCFNGMPKIIFVDRSILDKSTNVRNIYDIEWNYIPVSVAYPTDPNMMIDKPNNLQEMLNLAKKMSKNIPHVRVDFYSINDKTYFGELTFTHAAGYQKFEPKKFALEMGNWLELPNLRKTIECAEMIFSPPESKNPYINNTVRILKSSGIQVHSLRLKNIIMNFKTFWKIKIVHINWSEIYRFRGHLKFFLLKLFNKKIIWTMHDKTTNHDRKSVFKESLHYLVYKLFIIFSNKIIIHCNISKNILKNYCKNIDFNKVVYIPHGNYICNIKNYDIKKPNGKINFLFFGQIRPSKNIEILIEIFNTLQNVIADIVFELKIIGGCSDEYSFKLNNLLSKENKNISFEFKYIDNDELNAIIQKSDIAILPHNNRSSLNSGSIILAFSNKRTVIAPLIGTLEDIKEDFYYSYDYNNQEEHKKALTDVILKAIADYKMNPEIFNEKGEQAYRYMDKNNNWDIVKNGLLKVYEEFW